MNNKSIKLFGLLCLFCTIIIGTVLYTSESKKTIEGPSITKVWSTKKSKVKGGEEAFAKPDGFIEYFDLTSKSISSKSSNYPNAYRFLEYNKALKNRTFSAKLANNVEATFKSRGPGNVGGRTRAIAVDPEDDRNCTWIAGAASGGLWKTTDCGLTWRNISPQLPNLSTNSIAQSASDPNIIYVGTGEVFSTNASFVRGNGMYKSTDRGQTWDLLPSTVSNADFISVNRIAIDPSDPNIVVIGTNAGIFKSTDGGLNWVEKFSSNTGSVVQDLQVDPNNFDIQYAGVNRKGIYKSLDAGETWSSSSEGISEGIRFEVAVAPSNTNVVYTSSYVGERTILYYSADAGNSWVKVLDPDYDTNFLGGQGWYDNAIAVNPYNEYEVFVGGVNIGKFLVDPNDVGETAPTFLGLDENNTEFLSFINFSAQYNGGTLDIADGNLSPSTRPVNVEIRWGGDNQQKAHRFVVPSRGGTNGDGGAGIPTTEYTYVDYKNVPFEVWDIDNNRQLMVSFRDQQDDGTFNLNPRNDDLDPNLLTAREYLYIHDIDYNATTPNSDVRNVEGGIQYKNMYYFWPVLSPESSWDPASFTDAVLKIKYGTEFAAAANAVAVYDAYGSYEGQNSTTLHPDHHNLTFIKTDTANKVFMVVNGNDGALGYSPNNGVGFVEREKGYVTSQFYGADKKPGKEIYIGGTQDNGTWISTKVDVNETSAYVRKIGGDGFEVLWNSFHTDKVMGTIYNNRIYVSEDGGETFSSSSNGITEEDGPFITRLAGSNQNPNIVYAIGGEGVYKTTDFGKRWEMKEINDPTWGGNSSSSDVEVSLANPSIVWAGAGMFGGALNIFVSQDAGETYAAVNLPENDPEAFITGIATHPTDENTAYILFSVADQPKILKTEDLGNTWTDLSGFEPGATESNNGFPDVFTHSLLVMPFDTNVIWAGTEIGLFESLDGGASWNLRTDMPSVSIWSMKIVDDEVVMGTHGRGIWTATIDALNEVTITSNKEAMEDNYTLYPVPMKDVLHIQNSTYNIASVTIYSLGGRLVQKINKVDSKGLEVNVSGLTAGMYLVQLTDQKGKVRTAKVIKND